MHRSSLLALTLGLLVACSGSGTDDSLGTGVPSDAGGTLTDISGWDGATRPTPDTNPPDVTPQPVDATPDGQGSTGHGFGDPCETGDDCYSGLCAEHMGDTVCTKTCNDDCPTGWVCEQVTVAGGDTLYLCVSTLEHLCKPCLDASDCTSDTSQTPCVDYAGEGSFCGATCGTDADCPEGFVCQESVSTRGGSSSQCVDTDGVCECSGLAITLGLATSCSVTAQAGTCEGLRTCTDEGLTDCAVATPVVETCNGVDDDCDGEVDNVDCDDGDPCTTDNCDAEAGCLNTVTSGASCDDADPGTSEDTCTEDGACVGEPITCPQGECVEAGTPNGEDCDVTFKLLGTLCDDGDMATTEDICHDDGMCQGVMYTCEPGPCVPTATPNGVDCDKTYTPEGGACDDGDPATMTDVCDGLGVCAGQPYTCEPTQCEAGSTPDGAGCAVQYMAAGLGCDDGESTTKTDLCDGSGGCAGEVYTCEPALCQATSIPNGVDCDITYAPSGVGCDDSDSTTQVDACDGSGGCAGTAYTCEPTQCETASMPNGVDCDVTFMAVGIVCDDGDATTHDDMCDGVGGCAGTSFACVPGLCETSSVANGVDCDITYAVENTACDDADLATMGDHCDGSGGCEGTPFACIPEQCAASSVANGFDCDITHAAPTTPCDDGDLGTQGDQCDGSGGCAGTDYTCTPTQCEASSEPNGTDCTVTHHTNGCDDGDVTTQDDQCDGSGGCAGTDYTCMPTQCEASSTPNGTDCTVTYHTNGCDDGDACTTADACSGGACVGGAPPTCDDQNPCTDDSCVSPGGCVAPVSAAGASCPGGVCDGSTCVACLSGQVEHCNPQCGAFDTGTDGYRICTDNSWGTCQPVACEPGTPTYYQAVPVDHDWHCNLWMWPGAFTMYLCLKATNTFACGSPAIEFQLQKSDDVGGTVNFGAFDNDVSLVLRNVNSGLTRDVSQVNCAGQQTCTFTVGVSELINSLGLSGTDGFQADIKSPPGVTSVGTTGTANLVTCY